MLDMIRRLKDGKEASRLRRERRNDKLGRLRRNNDPYLLPDTTPEEMERIIKDSEKKKEKDNNNIYSLVIDYLNRKASTNYRASTKNTQGFINARVREGYTVEDFKKVIDSKSKEWLNTDFEKYLRPATLFGTKFENYLNEANKKTPTAIGAENKNIKVNPSICNNTQKYSRGVEML